MYVILPRHSIYGPYKALVKLTYGHMSALLTITEWPVLRAWQIFLNLKLVHSYMLRHLPQHILIMN